MLQQKQKTFLDEMVAHFNSTNRAFDEGQKTCRYEHRYNGGCAIGRKVPEQLAHELRGIVSDCFSMLPPELQELGEDFLNSVQRLHDVAVCWNETGLSPAGQIRYEEICKRYSLV